MTFKKLLLMAAVVAGIALFFVLDLGRYANLDYLKQSQAHFSAQYANNPWTMRLAFFGTYVAVASLSLPGAALLTLAGGGVFGFGWGLLMVSFASSMGATVSLWVARYVLRDWVQARFAQPLAAINAEVDTALNTAIPGSPTADSVNERLKTVDDRLPIKFQKNVARANFAFPMFDSAGALKTGLTPEELVKRRPGWVLDTTGAALLDASLTGKTTKLVPIEDRRIARAGQLAGDGADVSFTAQSMKSLLARLGVNLDGPLSDFETSATTGKVDIKNVAAVMVTESYRGWWIASRRIEP